MPQRLRKFSFSALYHISKNSPTAKISELNCENFLFPDDSDRWLNLGIIYLQKGQLKTTLQCYNYAIKNNPESYLAWYHLGSLLLAMEQTLLAVMCFKRSIRICPDFDSAAQLLKSINSHQVINTKKRKPILFQSII
ncbi:MAG: hypothetical protein FK734_21445 [Asgard group archaeon]|nr:hypothetical protein [Asgard group archaeon]